MSKEISLIIVLIMCVLLGYCFNCLVKELKCKRNYYVSYRGQDKYCNTGFGRVFFCNQKTVDIEAWTKYLEEKCNLDSVVIITFQEYEGIMPKE